MNINKLKGAIIEKGYSQRSLAEALGVSKTTINAKINEKTNFNVKEVEELCTLLGLEQERMIEIFFE